MYAAKTNMMVKTTLVVFIVVPAIVLIGLYILGNRSQTGKAPGLVSGRLSACPDKPNCVESEFPDDPSHYISPLRYPASMDETSMVLIKKVIQEVGGKIRTEEETYISATFLSTFFGFADDMEFRNEKNDHIIHVRSASRVGHSDFGSNRKRVVLIARLFNERIKEAHAGVFP